MKEHKISLNPDSPSFLHLDVADGCELVWQSQKELEPYVKKSDEKTVELFYPSSAPLQSGFYGLNIQIMERNTGQEIKSERYLIRVKRGLMATPTETLGAVKESQEEAAPPAPSPGVSIVASGFQTADLLSEEETLSPFQEESDTAAEVNDGVGVAPTSADDAIVQSGDDISGASLMTDVPQSAAEGRVDSDEKPTLELWEALNTVDIWSTTDPEPARDTPARSVQQADVNQVDPIVSLQQDFSAAGEPIQTPDRELPAQNNPVPQAAPQASVVNPQASPAAPQASVVNPQAPPVAPQASVVNPQAPPVAPQASVVNPLAPPAAPQTPVAQPLAPPAAPPQHVMMLPPLDGNFELVLLRNNVEVANLSTGLPSNRTTVVGRDPTCDLSLSDQFLSRDEGKKCSRRQLEIYWRQGNICIKNIGRNSVYFEDMKNSRLASGAWTPWDPAIMLRLPGDLSLQLRRVND